MTLQCGGGNRPYAVAGRSFSHHWICGPRVRLPYRYARLAQRVEQQTPQGSTEVRRFPKMAENKERLRRPARESLTCAYGKRQSSGRLRVANASARPDAFRYNRRITATQRRIGAPRQFLQPPHRRDGRRGRTLCFFIKIKNHTP